jgi:hypothetical protein
MFRETREGATPAVQFWYFPGEKVGKEFIYPKDQAERIAARTGADVRSETIQASAADVSPAPEPIAQAAEPVAEAAAAVAEAPAAVAEAITPAPEPAPQPVEERQIAAAPAPQAAPAPEPAPEPRAVGTSGQADELPRTASPLALTGLFGLLSLAGAAGIRAFRA